MRVEVSIIFVKLATTDKKLDLVINLLYEHEINPHLVSNTHAKKI